MNLEQEVARVLADALQSKGLHLLDVTHWILGPWTEVAEESFYREPVLLENPHQRVRVGRPPQACAAIRRLRVDMDGTGKEGLWIWHIWDIPEVPPGQRYMSGTSLTFEEARTLTDHELLKAGYVLL